MAEVTTWLRRPAVILVIIGLILPNLAFLVLYQLGIFVPPRTFPILLYLLAAVSLRFLPVPGVMAIYLLALGCDIVYCATQIFGLAPSETLFALQFIGQLDILSSKLYVALALGVSALFGLLLFLLWRHGQHLRHANRLPLLLLGLVAVPTDVVINTPRHSNFWLSLGRDIPFESAMAKSGYIKLVEQPNGRHMLVVIVEAMGRFADPKVQGLLDEAIRAEGVTQKYEVTSGVNSFIGGTTAAEMREFCGTRDSYLGYLKEKRPDCLPFHMSKAGYATKAYHGFTGKMFDRDQWWPNVGFEEREFGEDLLVPGEKLCGDVFVGICDPKLVGDIAAKFKAATVPQFSYLLTFNTHVPVIVDQGYHHLDCAHHDARVPEREVCIMADGWIELLQGIARAWADPAMPPTEILIVGDHAPPLWYRQAHDLFTPGEVSWFRLTPKA